MLPSGTMRAKWLKAAVEVVAISCLATLLLTVAVISLADRPAGSWIKDWVIYSMVFAASIGGLAAVVMPVVAPLSWRFRGWIRWSLLVTKLIAVALAGCAIGVGVIFLLGLQQGNTFRQFYLHSYRMAVVITLLIGIPITIYESFRKRIEQANLDLKNKQIEHERALKLVTEAQLASIESRIQPHFLFNALNSISSLIQEDPARAERLIERLAGLLRSSLDTHKAGLVPLERELKLVSDYLEIQAARFGPRLRFTVDAPPELYELAVPPFSAQTLVENSVKHSAAPRREGGEIRVTARAMEDRLVVEVWDDGPGFAPEAIVPGHGLENLHTRLRTLFGDHAGLEVRRRAPGVSVAFSVPRRVAPKDIRA